MAAWVVWAAGYGDSLGWTLTHKFLSKELESPRPGLWKQLRFKEKKIPASPHHHHERMRERHTQIVFPEINLRLTRRWALTLSEA